MENSDLPPKVRVCTCKQCRAQKALRKNRKLKSKIKRLINKRRRNGKGGTTYNHYWG